MYNSKELKYIFDYKPSEAQCINTILKKITKLPQLPYPIKEFLKILLLTNLSIASIGTLLPLIFKFKDLNYRVKQELLAEIFFQYIAVKIANSEVHPPSIAPIMIKTSTQGFNHINDYALSSNVLWYRKRRFVDTTQCLGDWKPLYLNIDYSQDWPISLSVDGANLTVIDNQGKVHYRKVFLEARGRNPENPDILEMDNPRIRRHLPEGFPSIPDYIVIDKSEKINWKQSWYNFPFLKRIANIFTGNALQISNQLIISHRGRFNNAYIDVDGHLHQSGVGVTNAYELNGDGSFIRVYDPWAPQWAKLFLYFPETEDYFYKVLKIDASASCLLAIGYKINKKTNLGQLTLITNFADIDILGNDPMLHYAYQTENIDNKQIVRKKMYILPDHVDNEGWLEHQLPVDLELNLKFYNSISIIQHLFNHREIRIAAKNGDRMGYFFKNLTEKSWKFEKYETQVIIKPLEYLKEFKNEAKNGTSLKNYSACLFKNIPAKLHNYGEKSSNAKVLINEGDEEIRLDLQHRWKLKNFLGSKKKSYKLIVPREIKFQGKLSKFFPNKVISVKTKICNRNGSDVIQISKTC